MTIGTSDGQTFNTKWDQYASQLGWKEPVENGPVIKNSGGSKDTTPQDKRTSDAPKGSGGPSTKEAAYIVKGTVHHPEGHGPVDIHGDYGSDLGGALEGAEQLRRIYRPNDPDAIKIEITPHSENEQDPRGMIPHITSEAKRLGIDPNVAIGVAKSEGLSTFKSSIPGENSFGAFQLYTGGGLGNEFQRKTGLDPSDPKNEKEGITFALEHAAQHGWSAFHGAKNTGISQWAGIPGDHIDIDRSHHVPLAASAQIDKDGNPTGRVSIHSGAPQMEDDIYHRGVAEHELTEAKMMKYYIKQGMDPYEAYTMAHEKFATPTESEFVKSERGEDFLENSYKPYWRQVAAMAKEQAESDEETNLGPQDHTSIYNLNREVKMKNVRQAGSDPGMAGLKDVVNLTRQMGKHFDYSGMRRSTNVDDANKDTRSDIERHQDFMKEYGYLLTPMEKLIVKQLDERIKEMGDPSKWTKDQQDEIHDLLANNYNLLQRRLDERYNSQLALEPPLPRPRPK